MKIHHSICSQTLFKFSKVYIALFILLFSSVKLFAIHDIELTGNITELGEDYLIVENTTFYVNGNTVFRGLNGESVTFSYFQLNDLVEVQGDSRGDGTYTAARVKAEDGPENENEIEITGYVINLGTDFFVIGNNTFYVNENTEYRGRHGEPFSFEQIKVGSLLEVKASLQIDGSLLAFRVKKEDDHQHGEEVEITGIIDSISTNSIFLGQWEFFVDSQTVILDDNRLPITFNDLNVGDKAEVKAFLQPDSTYLATRIKLEDQNENEIEITAQIESIVGTNITVGGITFMTDSNTVFLDHNRLPITIDDLSVGMFVEVKGVKNPDNSYYASRIKIEDFVQNEIEITGNITELNSESFVVNGITFTVDSTTQVFDHMNNPIEYSDLTVGQLIEVKGIKTGETTAKATRIKLEGDEDIEVFGRITAINTNSIELNAFTIFVDENTVYLNHAGEPITFEDLSVDLFVEVKMIKNPDNTFLALKIKIEDGINFSKLNGLALNVTGSTFQLPSGTYTVNNSTVVIDNNFNRININQLTNGQQILVWSTLDVSSNKITLQIQLITNTPTAVENNSSVINEFILNQNYPNPFNPSTLISFTIASSQLVTLKIYNAIGEEVRTLVNSVMAKGTYNINFNAAGLSSGMYFYRLESGNNVQIKKMMFLK